MWPPPSLSISAAWTATSTGDLVGRYAQRAALVWAGDTRARPRCTSSFSALAATGFRQCRDSLNTIAATNELSLSAASGHARSFTFSSGSALSREMSRPETRLARPLLDARRTTPASSVCTRIVPALGLVARSGRTRRSRCRGRPWPRTAGGPCDVGGRIGRRGSQRGAAAVRGCGRSRRRRPGAHVGPVRVDDRGRVLLEQLTADDQNQFVLVRPRAAPRWSWSPSFDEPRPAVQLRDVAQLLPRASASAVGSGRNAASTSQNWRK